MSSSQVSNDTTTEASVATAVPLRLEVVVIPVADVDRDMGFYQGLGWRLDADAAGRHMAEVRHVVVPSAT